MNWNLFADQILRQGEAAFRDLCRTAGVDPDPIIAAESARQAEARLEEAAETIKREGLDVSETPVTISDSTELLRLPVPRAGH